MSAALVAAPSPSDPLKLSHRGGSRLIFLDRFLPEFSFTIGAASTNNVKLVIPRYGEVATARQPFDSQNRLEKIR